MSYLESIPVIAGADLTAKQYKCVAVAGTIAADGTAIGLLQNKPNTGRDATVGYAGRSRFVASDTVAAGALLTPTTNGFMVTVGSGDPCFGRALSAVASGGIGEGIFNFANGLLIA